MNWPDERGVGIFGTLYVWHKNVVFFLAESLNKTLSTTGVTYFLKNILYFYK